MIRVLIVDDEEFVRQLLRQMLSTRGYDCILAEGGGMARLHLHDKPFDLVISDLNMPGESGLELLQYVALKHPQTAVMMISGNLDPEIAHKALEIGVRNCLRKPFRFEELLACAADALRERSANGPVQLGTQAATGASTGTYCSMESCSWPRAIGRFSATRVPSG